MTNSRLVPGTRTDRSPSADVGDLDGDGDPEVVVTNSDGPNRVYLERAAR